MPATLSLCISRTLSSASNIAGLATLFMGGALAVSLISGGVRICIVFCYPHRIVGGLFSQQHSGRRLLAIDVVGGIALCYLPHFAKCAQLGGVFAVSHSTFWAVCRLLTAFWAVRRSRMCAAA